MAKTTNTTVLTFCVGNAQSAIVSSHRAIGRSKIRWSDFTKGNTTQAQTKYGPDDTFSLRSKFSTYSYAYKQMFEPHNITHLGIANKIIKQND